MPMDKEHDPRSRVLVAFMSAVLAGSIFLTVWRTLIADSFLIIDDVEPSEEI